MEYTIRDGVVVITDVTQNDSSRRRIEVPTDKLARLVSELSEIERLL